MDATSNNSDIGLLLTQVSSLKPPNSQQTENDASVPFDPVPVGRTGQLVLDVQQPLCRPATHLPLDLGPFQPTNPTTTLESQFLKPKPSFPSTMLSYCQRIWTQEPNLSSLLQATIHHRHKTTLSVGTKDAVADILHHPDLSDYVEVSVPDSDLTAKNSASMLRDPAPRSDTVRGKTTFMPFMPGGMTRSVLDAHSGIDDARSMLMEIHRDSAGRPEHDPQGHGDLVDDLIKLGGGSLLTVPPGMDRGIAFNVNKDAPVLDVSKLLRGDDEILAMLLEDQGQLDSSTNKPNAVDQPKFGSKDEKEKKDIDELLPSQSDEASALISKPSHARPNPLRSVKREYAHMIDVNQDFPEFTDLVPHLAHAYPFTLDTFQQRAIYHLENSESVFIAAHTSAGKTVIAEYAIALAQKHMTRAIYTSPIKALSNQKFRDFRTTFGDVGILTGDVQINPEASCLVMTTEILRSMLYRGADLIRDVEFVIFDEVHYVNDVDRGVVWEEVIIMLPAHVTLILLSATVPNTKEFADWVGRTKQKDIYVISTPKRPVPLEHYLYVEKDLYKIVDSTKTFLGGGYKAAYEVIHPPKKEVTKPEAGRGRGGHRGRGRGSSGAPSNSIHHYGSGSGGRNMSTATDKNMYVHMIGMLKKKNLLPVIVFTFSKRKCEEYANALVNIDLTSGASEKSEIHVFIERSLATLQGSDRQLPQVMRMRELLSRGIAVHHGGLLPIIKELVEILFTRGLVKVLFATETFAMGVNAPARCVVFSMIRKHDGQSFRDLMAGEYTQMSGRAGRRGLDDTGMVIIACNDDIPDQHTLSKMILGTPTKLASQFRITYNMILNLLRVEAIKIEDMIKRSFSENVNQKALPEQQERQKEIAKMLEMMQRLECTICSGDIYPFYEVSSRALMLGYQVHEKLMRMGMIGRVLTAGRVVIVNTPVYRNAVAVVLRTENGGGMAGQITMGNQDDDMKSMMAGMSSARGDKMYWMLVLGERQMSVDGSAIENKGWMNRVMPVTYVSVPAPGRVVEKIELVPYAAIGVMTSKMIKVDVDKVMASRDKRGDASVTEVGKELLKVAQEMKGGLIPEYDWSKIRDAEFQETVRERRLLMDAMPGYECVQCPDLVEHYGQVHDERRMQDQVAELGRLISDENLEMLPEYHQRVSVLKTLGFVDAAGIVQIKGRVACEMNTADELFVTELIFDNFFGEFDAAEVVALLSVFVFQEKSQSEPVLTPRLEEGVDAIRKLAVRVATIERESGMDVREDDALRRLHVGLVEVVYEWARGMPFKTITQLTDVLEGSIVRCIVRLSETCREVAGAARVLGDVGLYRKMEEAGELIRRDIVFAASLYF